MFKKVNLKEKVGKRQYYRRISQHVTTDMKNIFCNTENKGRDTKKSDIITISNSENIDEIINDETVEIDSDVCNELPYEDVENIQDFGGS